MNVEYNLSGIKCDNNLCGFKDESVSFDNYKDYINKPCPNCGENLLTENDYENACNLISVFELMNNFSEDELTELTKNVSIEDIKKLDILKNAKGIDNLNKDVSVLVKLDTHKEIKITEILTTK